MKTNHLSFGANNLISIGLAIVAAYLVFGVLTGRRIPLISEDRAALVGVFVIGFAMCAMGIGRVSAAGQWTHPLTILGYLLGALIMVVAAAGYFGFRLAFITDPRGAMIAVAGLMAGKMVLGIVHILLK